MKILAIDYGERRIGLAIGQSDLKMAFPRDGIDTKEHPPIPYLTKLITSEKFSCIVMGMPHREDGKTHEKSRPIRTFAKELEENTGLAIFFQDESYSTVQAKSMTSHFSKKKKQQNKKRLDSAAAAVILQDYLEENF